MSLRSILTSSISLSRGIIMTKGTLCKVVMNGHVPNQLGDKVLLVSIVDSNTLLFAGINLRTNTRHNYYRQNLEVISESRRLGKNNTREPRRSL